MKTALILLLTTSIYANKYFTVSHEFYNARVKPEHGAGYVKRADVWLSVALK